MRQTLIQATAVVTTALILAVGLNLAVDRFRATERYVTVKGLAEREVPADLAIWPVTFAATGPDPARTQAALTGAERRVRAFLAARAFEDAEIGKGPPRVTDARTQGYGNPVADAERFRAELTLTLRSTRVDAVRDAARAADELVADGVLLGAQWGDAVQYLFTELNEIKPPMIADATGDARAAARRFAEDSGATVGGIRRATQGYFSITDRDAWTPEIKTVRVVTTVEYFLE